MSLPANWKTTISGIGAAIFSLLSILAALPYENGVLANIFPVEWKPRILQISIVAALILKIWNSMVQKDKNVTGGTTQQTTRGAVAEAGTQTLVDATVRASIESGENVTQEQKKAVQPWNS